MNEAEMVQYYWSAIENGISTIMMYVSMFTGYLVMAYLVGKRLTALQNLIATGALLLFGGFCIWGTTVCFNSAYVVAKGLQPSWPELRPIELNPAIVSLILQVIGLLGALKFMWDIRHPKID